MQNAWQWHVLCGRICSMGSLLWRSLGYRCWYRWHGIAKPQDMPSDQSKGPMVLCSLVFFGFPNCHNRAVFVCGGQRVSLLHVTF